MKMMTSYPKIQTLFSYNNLLKNAFTKTTTINITRHMARRDKLYGVEEGHAEQKVYIFIHFTLQLLLLQNRLYIVYQVISSPTRQE